MEGNNDFLSRRKPLADNLNYKSTDDANSSADLKLCTSPNPSEKSYVPLKEINTKAVQEYMNSIENAQKAWVEKSKSWTVEDEIQNAQLQWLKDFSINGPKFLCTSTPQPKKKVPYTLPFSPPKSSADSNPHRGLCVYYKPTTKPGETKEYIDEKGYSVKVARLVEDPPKTSLPKRTEDDVSRSSRDGRINHPAHSSEKDLKQTRKSPVKRYITVRKKLERLKKPSLLEVKAEDRDRSSTSPEMKPDAKREAARQYILKKRAERERLLEEERKLEAKALEEKKARLERLRETQQRLIKNALKKPFETTLKPGDEIEMGPQYDSASCSHQDEVSSQERAHSSDFYHQGDSRSSKSDTLSSRRSTYSVTKSTSDQAVDVDQKISAEMKPPDNGIVDLKHPIVELLLNKDVPSSDKAELFELLEEGLQTRRQEPPDSRLVDDLPEECRSLYNLSPIRCDKYNLSLRGNDKSSAVSGSTLTTKRSSTSPRQLSPVSSKPSTSYKREYEVLDPVNRSASNSSNSLSSSNKENQHTKEWFEKYENVIPFDTPANLTPCHKSAARPYNMMMAIANKRAVLEQLEKDSQKTEPKKNKQNDESFNRVHENVPRSQYKEGNPKLHEKGVQCHVEKDKSSSSLDGASSGYRGTRMEKVFQKTEPRRNKHDGEFRRVHENIFQSEYKEGNKKLYEKGVQCGVQNHNYRSSVDWTSSDYRGTSMDSSGIHYTQSERLQKPDVTLRPGRTSDPYIYAHSKIFQSQNEVNALGVTAENESVFQNLGGLSVVTSEDIKPGVDEARPSSRLSVNGKGRPLSRSPPITFHESSQVNPLTVPRDLTLITPEVEKKDDSKRKSLKKRKSPRNITASEHSSVNYTGLPLSYNHTPVLHDSGVEDDNNRSQAKSEDTHPDHLNLTANLPSVKEAEEGNESGRDSRIEKEIRRLESFNESITSAMEKNKNIVSQSEFSIKSSCEESSVLEKTCTSSTVNNDLLIETSYSNIHGGHSSSSLELPSEDISGTSVAKFSLKMFTEILKDEDMRSAHQVSLFKMRESTISEKAKAEIAFLELEKKKLKEAGNEEGLRNIRKRVRGIIIKLEQDLEELHRVRRLERNSYRKRREKLVNKINAIKLQLKAQYDMQNKPHVLNDGANVSNSAGELKKIHITERRVSDRSFLEKKKRDLERRENLLAEKLSELENISSWKQRLEEGEKRIQELEARLKMQSSQGNFKDIETSRGLVERGTSPFRQLSDESPGERQKAEGSYSDTFDQASSSSAHERLEGKDARKMMAIKVPLSPQVTLKRRHSSGSDESLLFSQTETQSEASDMEVRVLALQQQLKQRKAKLETLHKEYKKSQRERLIAKEQSLLSQIQAYDLYIEQVKKEIEKEREVGAVKIVRPLIKQPKIISERRKSDTWLIQEKDKLDESKHSSSFLVTASGMFLGSPTKDTKRSNNERSSFNLDTKSIERLSLKSKLPLKASLSDSNLLQDIEEPACHIKVSQSSTESCESDMERGKLFQKKSNIFEIDNQKASKENDILIKIQETSTSRFIEVRDEFLKSDSDLTGKEGKHDVGDTSEPKTDVPEEITHPGDLEQDDSEENTITQQSIVSKIFESPEVVQHSNRVEENADQISLKSILDSVASDKNISEVVEATIITAGLSSPVSENDASRSNSEIHVKDNTGSKDKSVEEEISLSYSNEIQSKHTSKSLPEVISEHISVPKDEPSVDDIPESLPVEPDNSVTVSIKTQSPENLNSVISEVTDEQVDQKSNSVVIEELENVSENEECEKEPCEESFREVTYLEISDHVISDVADRHISSEDIPPEQKLSPLSTSDSHETQATETVADEAPSVLKETTQDEHSSRKEESLIETEDQFSKNTSADTSDFSFPLPITKDTNKLQEKSPTKIMSPSESSIHSKKSDEINEPSGLELSKEESPNAPSASEVEESVHTEIQNASVVESHSIKTEESQNEEKELSKRSFHSKSGESVTVLITEDVTNGEENSKSKEVESVIDEASENDQEDESLKHEDIPETGEEEQSFSEILDEADVKSPFDESNVDDSIAGLSDVISNLIKSNVDDGDNGEEFESHSESSNSFDGEKLSEEDIYNVKTPLLQPQQMWNRETDSKVKRAGAPLIEALQREGGSALDVVWRDIAETTVEEATDLVLSTYIRRKNQEVDIYKEVQTTSQTVGDNDEEEWRKEKLSQQQAEAEAEILRLQQLRIDKEIEELEEEEARQFFYVRAIPDKPPPPYTPRRSSLVTNVVEAAGEIWSGQTTVPVAFMPGSQLREFIWDLAGELVRRVNPPPPSTNPPWVQTKRSKPRKPIRTKEELLEEVEKEAKIYLGVEEREVRENLIIRWSRKRRDHVDEILVRESQEGEWEWTDFTEEENIVKNRITDMLIQDAIASATEAIAQAFERKLNSGKS